MDKSAIGNQRIMRRLLAVGVVLLVVIVVGVWDGSTTALPEAHGQIPDTGLQRRQILEEQRKTNELLSAILEHLRTEPIKVRIEATDKRNEPARGRDGNLSDR